MAETTVKTLRTGTAHYKNNNDVVLKTVLEVFVKMIVCQRTTVQKLVGECVTSETVAEIIENASPFTFPVHKTESVSKLLKGSSHHCQKICHQDKVTINSIQELREKQKDTIKSNYSGSVSASSTSNNFPDPTLHCEEEAKPSQAELNTLNTNSSLSIDDSFGPTQILASVSALTSSVTPSMSEKNHSINCSSTNIKTTEHNIDNFLVPVFGIGDVNNFNESITVSHETQEGKNEGPSFQVCNSEKLESNHSMVIKDNILCIDSCESEKVVSCDKGRNQSLSHNIHYLDQPTQDRAVSDDPTQKYTCSKQAASPMSDKDVNYVLNIAEINYDVDDKSSNYILSKCTEEERGYCICDRAMQLDQNLPRRDDSWEN